MHNGLSYSPLSLAARVPPHSQPSRHYTTRIIQLPTRLRLSSAREQELSSAAPPFLYSWYVVREIRCAASKYEHLSTSITPLLLASVMLWHKLSK